MPSFDVDPPTAAVFPVAELSPKRVNADRDGSSGQKRHCRNCCGSGGE